MTGVLDLLAEALPADRLDTDPLRLAEHGRDRSGSEPGAALVLVRPRSTAEVAAAVEAAHRAGAPVVPQGGRSGLVGAAQALPGSILLDLTGMNRILAIDPVDRSAIVQPGVVVRDLQDAVAARGLQYAPDPASAEIATIGGSIATNAGGMRCLKYGVTRDSVLSLEIVLADGTITRTRQATVKGVTGLDLTSLIVGSEGTLAVITEATVSLRPAPAPPRGVAATFPDAEHAFRAANAVLAGRRLPSTLEFLDAVAIAGIRAVAPELGLDPEAKAWLLALTDDWHGAEDDLAAFEAAFRANGAIDVRRADDPAGVESLLQARRALSPGLRAVRGGTTHGDLAVPRSALPRLAAATAELSSRLGVGISLAGHVGDGNLHPTVVFDPDDADEVRRSREAEAELLALATCLGGTVAGEHGVGELKLAAARDELDGPIRRLQRAIKADFDPRGILNPGRKLP